MSYGVFETFRTYHGKPFAVEAHLRRLRQGAKLFRISVPLSNQELTNLLQRNCRPRGETRLKLCVTPNDVTVETKPWRIPKKIYRQGVSLTTYRYTRPQPIVKSLRRTREDDANTRAIRKGHFDALLVNQQGRIPEAACGNIFYVMDGVLYTPNRAILFGITRAIVIQLAKKRLPIRYHTPTLEDLITADECFLTRSGSGIVPVVKIKQQRIGNGRPGPVTKKLMKLFDAYTNR